MFNIGFQEAVMILGVALIVLGPKSLPDAARQLGKAFVELRKVTDDMTSQVKEAMKPLEETKSSLEKIAEPIQEVKSAVSDPTAYVKDQVKKNIWDSVPTVDLDKEADAATTAEPETTSNDQNDLNEAKQERS